MSLWPLDPAYPDLRFGSKRDRDRLVSEPLTRIAVEDTYRYNVQDEVATIGGISVAGWHFYDVMYDGLYRLRAIGDYVDVLEEDAIALALLGICKIIGIVAELDKAPGSKSGEPA